MDMSSIQSTNRMQMGQMQGMQGGQRPQPPLKEQVQSMSTQQQEEFKSTIDSMSHEQKRAMHHAMMENKDELSSLSGDEFSSAIMSLAEQVSSGEYTPSTQGAQGSTPPPPPPMKSMIDSLSDEDKESFKEQMSSLSGEQRMNFGAIMKSMSEDISSMSSEELKDTISSALNDAKSNNSSSTQKASSMLSGSFLLNTYA
jgi:hypothetical protein